MISSVNLEEKKEKRKNCKQNINRTWCVKRGFKKLKLSLNLLAFNLIQRGKIFANFIAVFKGGKTSINNDGDNFLSQIKLAVVIKNLYLYVE